MNVLSNYFAILVLLMIHVKNIQSLQSLYYNKALTFNNRYKLTSYTSLSANNNNNNNNNQNQYNNPRSKISKNISILLLSILSYNIFIPEQVFAKPEGVNRPDLLPKEPTTIIDVANFLSKGQEKKAKASIEQLEKATGFKLRVLCQSYPNTPGLAIKDYWNVDDNTVVLVVDRGEGFNRKGFPSNILNLNIGKNVDLVLPNMFWSRLSNKLGNQPYVQKNGEDVAVLNTIEAITYCLQDKQCVDLPFSL